VGFWTAIAPRQLDGHVVGETGTRPIIVGEPQEGMIIARFSAVGTCTQIERLGIVKFSHFEALL
jgi:hypothetical protein